MGVSKDAAQLAGKFRKAAKYLDDSEILAAKAGATLLKKELGAAGTQHGPLHSRKGKAIRLTARYEVKGEAGGRTVVVQPRPPGAWQIVETGAGAHLIGKAPTRGRRKGQSGYLKGSRYGHPVRGPVAHPGARGSRTWTTTVARARPRVIREMQKAPLKAIRDVFG